MMWHIGLIVIPILKGVINESISSSCKRRKKPFFYKLLSDKKIYEFDVSKVSLVEYSSEHLLDEDSWFKIDNFSQQPFFLNFLGKQFVSSEYNSISKSKYKDIAYLCSVQDGEYFFQKVTPSSYVTKTFLALGDELVIENNVDRLLLIILLMLYILKKRID
ncbi:hypothetical protein AB3515_16480 [Acinetobacter baumannii]